MQGVLVMHGVTVTVKSQEATLLQQSVASQWTRLVVPGRNTVPEAGVNTNDRLVQQLLEALAV